MKFGRIALLSFVLLVAGAAPASAAPVVLAVAKPWHYWIAFVLMASFLGMVAMLGLGYLVRVTMAKYGIRIGHKRSTG